MSGENDDLFSQSAGALLFPDLSDNGDDLDFTKDFFSDALHHSHDLNGSSYESMGGDDLIAELEGQDVFSRLGSSELNGVASFGVDIDQKSGLSLSTSAHTKPFSNGQILSPYGNFQKPSINVHMNTSYPSSGVSDMFMQRNGIAGLTSPTSPAVKSNGLLSPGATSEKLNCLSLDQMYPSYRQSAYDVKGNRTFSKGGPYSSAGVMPHSPSDKRFCSSPLSSPTVQAAANSNGISPFATSAAQDMVHSIISSSDGMHSTSNQTGHPTESGTSPVSLSSSSTETKDSADCMLVGDSSLKIQQTKPLFMSSPTMAHRMSSAIDGDDFVSQVDANGDGLRPLPSPMQHSSRPPIMQRSFSSHALGQLRTIAPTPQASDQSVNYSRMPPADAPSRFGNSNGAPHIQPQLSELQHLRPLMHSMRRVHSTGDIQTLNGMQMATGGSSPSSLDRSNYEEGGFKIGRYTVEERKIRIHRYQQKRTQRNFNKKIKYACRKTLADSRPRVRGRFAKNDEVGEPLTKQNGVKHEDEDEEEGEMLLLDEEEELFGDEDSSGDLSDMLNRNVGKLEHPSPKGVKIEHQSTTHRNKPLQI